jgi:hypothetical protein
VTAFDVLLVLALGALAALVLLPERQVRRVLAGEDRAVEDLVDLDRRLRDHQRASARDDDRDGVGEFAPLTEALGARRDDARRVGDTDVWVLGGYRFAVLVPGARKLPVLAGTPEAVPDYAEVAYLLVAWPEEPGTSGMRAYASTPSGILQHQIDGYPYGDRPPFPDAPMIAVEGARIRRADRYAGKDWAAPVRALRAR